ncbi:MAG: P-loop NTPase fold protein [Methylococcales bacterium]
MQVQGAKLVGLESAPFSPGKIQVLGEAWEKERLESSLASDDLREYLQGCIGALLPKKPGARVVIFIDDLDRCHAGMAYRFLEGLKIYLNLDNCVFLLAMNQQVTTDAIAESLKKDEHDATVKLRAEAYLEKLCANIWRLPPPDSPVDYFVDLLDEEAPKTAIREAAAIPEAAPNTGHGFLPPNPRRLKALANLYNRLWPKAVSTLTDSDSKLALRMLVIAYVYQFHTEVYQRWRHDPYFFETLRGWIDTTGQADPHYFQGLTLPTRAESDPSTPTPIYTTKGNYPDPAAPGVFWIATLLQTALKQDGPENYQDLLRLDR